MSAAFELARAALSQRLRNRAEFWRRRKPTSKLSKAELHIRALEADLCAEIAEELNIDYEAPDGPDMSRVGKRRRKDAGT